MADIALVYSVIGGPDPRDPTSRPEAPPPAALDLTNARPPRIGVVRNFYPERTEPVMQSAIEDSASRLKAAGATVTDALLPDDFGLLWMVHRLINGVEGGTFRARRYAEAPATPIAARDLAASLVPAAYYLQAQRIRRYLWQKLQGMFADFDMLLMAVASGAAPEGIQTTGEATLLIPWSCAVALHYSCAEGVCSIVPCCLNNPNWKGARGYASYRCRHARRRDGAHLGLLGCG